MKVVFMGTPEFAVGTLKKCIEKHDVIAVFTQPDKPKGRGNKMTPPPVKVVAEQHGIPVFQPERLRKAPWPEQLKDLAPDVIVVVAYGQLLTQEVLDIPKFGCINIHASLLPKYRGAAPINWAIANGEPETGVTTQMMNAGLDTGDILLKWSVPIGEDMNAGELHDILAVAGADLLIETLDGLENGTLVPEVQNDAESCYAIKLSKEIARIDWNMSAVAIKNRINGFNPWPVAHTSLHEQPFKIFSAKVFSDEDQLLNADALSGSVVKIDKNGIYVKTGDGLLLIEEVQWGSGKRMSAGAFLLGNPLAVGTYFN